MALPRAKVKICPKCGSEDVEGYQGRQGDETLCNICGWTSEDHMMYQTLTSL